MQMTASHLRDSHAALRELSNISSRNALLLSAQGVCSASKCWGAKQICTPEHGPELPIRGAITSCRSQAGLPKSGCTPAFLSVRMSSRQPAWLTKDGCVEANQALLSGFTG